MNVCTEKDILFIEHHREDNANVILNWGPLEKLHQCRLAPCKQHLLSR